MDVTAVDGEQIFACDDIDAGLRERRVELRIPVLAVVNAREAVAAVFDFVIRAEKADLQRLHFRNVAAADEHVADIDFAKHLREEVIQIVARGDAVEIRLDIPRESACRFTP